MASRCIAFMSYRRRRTGFVVCGRPVLATLADEQGNDAYPLCRWHFLEAARHLEREDDDWFGAHVVDWICAPNYLRQGWAVWREP